jgi:hypothetical protein
VSESAPLFLDEAREHYAARLTGRGNRPLARVRVAQLGEAAAVVGRRSWPASTRSRALDLRAVVVLVAVVRGSGPEPQDQPAQPGGQREQAERQPVDVRDSDDARAITSVRPSRSRVIPTAAGGPIRGSGGGSGGTKCSKRSVSGPYGRAAAG